MALTPESTVFLLFCSNKHSSHILFCSAQCTVDLRDYKGDGFFERKVTEI